ncbi:Ig-like domain repeat protein [Methanobrevibacter sp.]|uniref:Ig-like domain repeat protein n=1 Tax=Methanobrevibacter sp. TaxID=66852 RepID=UPI00388D47C8
MIGKRKILIFAILLICLSAVGFASAADNTADAVGAEDTSANAISTDENEEVILEDEYDEKLSKRDYDPNAAPLSEFRSYIVNNQNSVINLTCDYEFKADDGDSFEVIELNRDVTIDGQGHYVNGHHSSSPMLRVAEGKNVVVKNLTINTFNGPTVTGGTYINCKFILCASDNNAAVYKGTAINCLFEECLSYGNNAGGAAMREGRAINCTFNGNTATYGGAISRSYAENCTFYNNKASHGGDTDLVAKGGAAYESTCYNCYFKDNWVTNQGGAGYKGTYVNCTFEGNHIKGSGDGLTLYEGEAIFCTFDDKNKNYRTSVYEKMIINADDFTCKYNSSSAFPFKLTAGSIEFKDVNMTFHVEKAEDGVWHDLYEFNILSGQKWIVNLTPGNYRVKINCIDYPADEVSVIITIPKMGTAITLDNNNISMFCKGDNELIITLNDDENRPVANRTVIFDFKGKLMANVTDENGMIRVALNDLVPRTYNVDITFDGDELYSKSAAKATVTVSKIPTMIIGVPAITVNYNNSNYNIPVGVLDYLNRPVSNVPLTVELNGIKKDYVTDENGNVFVPTLGLTPGTYSALFSLNNKIYADAYAQTIVTVTKVDVTISGGMTRAYNQEEDSRRNYMGITLSINPNGDVYMGLRDAEISVSLNGINGTYITDMNGVAYVSTNGLAAGSYFANVTYKGNEFISAKNYLAEIIINKAQSQIYCDSDIMHVNYGIEDYFNITLKGEDGNPIKGSNIVTVDLDGVAKTYITDENGLLKIPTEDLSVNFYGVNIAFNGNENYTGSKTYARLIIDKDASVLSSDNLITIYGETGELIVNLTGSQGRPVSGADLTVNMNNVEKNYVTDANGQIRIPVEGLAAGNYTADITFNGNNNYEKSNLTANITVNKCEPHLSFDEYMTRAVYGYESLFNVTLKDGNYNTVKGNHVLIVNLNGVKTYTTNENGTLTISTIDLPANEYYVATVTYDGNENFTSAINYHRIIVAKQPTELTSDNLIITYNNEGNLIVTLKNSLGEILSNYTLTVDFNGKKDYVTDENGQIEIPVSGLAAGEHSANITFDGTDNYEESSLIVNITVNKAEPIITFDTNLIKTIYGFENSFNVTLKDNNYNPIKANNTIIADFDGIIENYTTDENGVAVIYTTDLPVDYYWVALSFSGDENYTETTNYIRVIVYKQPTELVSDNITTTYNSGENLEITLLDAFGKPLSDVPVTVNFYGVKTYTTDKNGTIEVPTAGLDPSDYLVFISYAGSQNYNQSSLIAAISIVKDNTTMDINWTIADNDVDITVDVDPNATGLVKFEISGPEEYTTYSEIVNGKAISHNVLAEGEYSVTATYGGDVYFNSNSTRGTFTVRGHVKKDTPITADVKVEEYTVTITANVDSDATGNVTVDVLGQKFLVPVEDGKAVFTYDFAPATYSAEITYLGDNDFNSNSTSVSFTVTEQVVELKNTTISADVTSVENDVTITASINPLASGLIEFNINGKAVYVAVISGKAVYNTNLPAGDYNVAVTYLGDFRYNANRTSKAFTVTDHIKKNTTITSDVVVNGHDITVTVNLDNDATGFVEFTLNNNTIYVKVTDGKAVYNAVLPTGNYTLAAKYLGDEDFNINVSDIPISVVEIPLNDTPVDLDIEIFENNVTITASFDPKATGLVKFEVTGAENYTLYAEIENGKAVLKDVLTAGDYSVVATYLGDSKFNPNSTAETFTIVGHVKKDTAISAVSDVEDYTVTITASVDANATGYVTLSVLGQTFIVPVENGKAVFTYDFNPSTYNVDVAYLGDDNFNNATTTTSFTVVEKTVELKNTTVDVNVETNENDVTITATVNPAASGLVEFNIDGKAVYIAVANGKAVYNTDLAAGDYNVLVTYLGDSRFNANRTSKAFTVTDHVKKNTSMTSDVTVDGYDVTVTVSLDSEATGFVEFTLNGNSVYAKVDGGEAIFNALLPAGNYTLNAKYLGDEDFNVNATDISISVAEIPLNDTPITVEVLVNENNVTMIAAVDPAATGLVKFEVTGAEDYTLYAEIKDGKAVLEDILAVGDYSVVATYMGDFKFNPNSTAETFTVTGHIKKDTPISAVSSVDKNTVTIVTTVDSTATGYVTLSVLGQTFIVPVNNGEAVFTYDFEHGTYSTLVTYLGDDDFNNASTVTSFTVIKEVVELKNTTISVDVTSMENNVTIEATVDSAASGLVEFDINGDTVVYIAVNNGKAIYNAILPAGDYTVFATYMGDSRFNSNRTSKAFTVTDHIKKNTTITSKVDVYGYDVIMTVYVDEDATGFVKFITKGNEALAEVKDGRAVMYMMLPAGNYTTTAAYLGDDDFNANATDIEIEVIEINRENTTIAADVETNENNVTITVYVDPQATGLVKFEITGAEDRTLYAEVADGKAVLEEVLTAGDYSVVATYMGDIIFNTNTTSKEFTVIGHIKKDTPISADVAVDGYRAVISVDVDSDATGFVEVKLGETVMYIALTNGEGSVITTLPAGSYQADLTYLGDDNFNENATSVSFNVVDPAKENTAIELDVNVVENNITITASVDPAATGLVKFEVTGAEEYNLYAEVKDGKAVLEDVLTAGDYSVVATYMGDTRFNPNSTAGTFTVTGHIKKDTAITAVPTVDKYTVTIESTVDSQATGYVTIAVLGQTFIVPVENGKAVFTYDFEPGTYSAVVTYLGDDNFNNATTNAAFTVIKETVELKNTTVDVNVETNENDVTITASVDPAASGLVEFNIDGEAVYIAVNNGKAIYSTILPAGNYTVVATYMGDSKFNSNRTSKAFTVTDHIKKNTTIIPDVVVDGYDVTVTVNVDENATGFVEFTLNNNTIYAKVSEGKTVMNMLLPAGSYTATAAYLGDDDFNANATEIEIKVDEIYRKNTPIAADVELVENNVTITVNVDPAATGLVKFEVTGAENYTVYSEVKDGKAVLEDVLSAGDYTVFATYMGDTAFNTNITSEEFTVIGHIKKDTPITAEVKVNGYRVTIDVTVDTKATGFVEVYLGDTEMYVALTDGKGTLTTNMPAGSYQAALTYLGDDDFNENATAVSFNVADPVKENTTIELDIKVAENNVTFTATVDSDATGLVKFEVNGDEKYTLYADVTNGKAVLEDIFKAGDYVVTATYMGDARFNTNITSEEFTVIGHVKKDTPITADVKINGYKVTIDVTVDEKATGFVEVNLGETVMYIALNEGKGSVITNMPAGSYQAALTYLGDNDFNENATAVSFNVADPVKENTTIELDVKVSENNVTFTATVDSDATGLVKFEVNGDEKYTLYADVTNGKAVLEDVFKAGDYTVIATYMGDSRFNTNMTSEEFTVIGHVKKDTPISAVATVSGYKVTIDVTVDTKATGFVEVKLGETVMNIALTDGKGTLTTTMQAGSYHADLTYLGDDNFNKNSTNVLFTVVDPIKENTPISLDVTSTYNNVSLTATVNSAATGIVKFEVSGPEHYVLYVDVENGVAVLEDVLKAGDYTVVATYMGDKKFNANETSSEFTISDKQKEDSNVTINIPEDIKVGEDIPIEVSIPGATGNVSVIVDGKETIVPLDENGKASVSIENITAGDHNVVVIYSGDDTHAPAHAVSRFSIPETPVVIPVATRFSEITVMDDLTIYMKLVDADGTPISDAEISYMVGDVSGSTTTEADGSFTIKGASGVVISVNYAGNDTYLATNTSIKLDNVAPERLATQFNVTNGYRLQVYAVDYKAGERGAYFDVLLRDSNGKPLANQAVYFAINGWVHNKTTDANGVAHLQINLQDANYYTCAPCYLGNTTYEATFASAMLDVVKKPITITAAAKSYKATAKTKTYTVTIKTTKGSSADGKVYLSAGKKVTLKVNGKTYTAKTNAKGQATFSIKLTKKGKFQTVIKFAGDKTYNSASKQVTITIK